MALDIKKLTSDLKSRLEDYQEKTGLPMEALCRRAAGSASFFERLSGGNVTLQICQRVTEYLDANPAENEPGYRKRQPNTEPAR